MPTCGSAESLISGTLFVCDGTETRDLICQLYYIRRRLRLSFSTPSSKRPSSDTDPLQRSGGPLAERRAFVHGEWAVLFRTFPGNRLFLLHFRFGDEWRLYVQILVCINSLRRCSSYILATFRRKILLCAASKLQHALKLDRTAVDRACCTTLRCNAPYVFHNRVSLLRVDLARGV